MAIRRVRPVRFPKPAGLTARLLGRRSTAARLKRKRADRLPWCEAICLRCDAPIAIGEQIGRAELPYIVDHLRSCAAGAIPADEKPSLREVVKHIRIRIL